MRIAFMLAANMALDGPGNGVRVQALQQAQALEQLGHEVQRLCPWSVRGDHDYDLVQFFTGGLGFAGIEHMRQRASQLVFAPIIDSNQPQRLYRVAAALGNFVPNRVFTIPGEFRKQARASDLVICRSTHERERLERGLGVESAKLRVVLNGVEPPGDADPEEARRRFGLPSEFLLHVSRYTEDRKNVIRLVEAVGPLDLPLVIAGTAEPGSVLDRLNALAGKYRHVRLLGWQDRPTLNSLYAACKVFCLPSLHEGTGLAALEAASYGAAVVITRNGGPPDYFLDMAEYAEPGSTEDIRAAIERACCKPRDGRLREHVLSHLTWEQSARALERSYRQHGPALA